MTPIDKNLLLRIARRLEEQADDAWRSGLVAATDTKALEQVKRRRDRELGDAKDLRDYVRRTPVADPAKAVAA